MRLLVNHFDMTDYTRQETLKVEHDLGDPIPVTDIILEDPLASSFPFTPDCLQEACILDEPFAYNQARNFVVDPILANGSTSYTVSNPISATLTYTSNQFKAKVSNASVGTTSISQTTQQGLVQPGQSYMFSAYLTLTDVAFDVPRSFGSTILFSATMNPLNNANAYLQMDFLDAGSNLVTSVLSANYTTGARQQVSISGVAPAGCYYIKVYCVLATTNATNSGTVVFDTLQLEPMYFINAGAHSTQSYPSPDCVTGQANCRVLANGVTIRENRLFCGYVTNLDAEYEGANRLWTVEVSGPAFVTAATSITTTDSNKTDTQIFLDIVNDNFSKLFTTQNVLGTGYQFDQVEWEDVFVRDVFNSITQAAGDSWFIDPYFDVHCYPPGTNQAAFELSDSPDNVTTFPYYNYKYNRSVSQMANRLKVFGAGANNTNPVTSDTFSGNGSNKIFTLSMRPETITSVTVGGTSQKVGQFGIDTNGVNGIQCLVNKGTKQIIFNTAPPNVASNVVVNYNFFAPAVMRLWDMGSISKYGLILDSKIDDGALVTNADVLQRGLQDLQNNSTPFTAVTLSTQQGGLQVGDTVPLTSAPDSLLSTPFTIQKVRSAILGTDDTNATQTEYQVTLGPYLPTFLHHMKFVHKSVKHARTKTSVAPQEHLVTFDRLTYSENPTVSIDTSGSGGVGSDFYGVTIGINPGTGQSGSPYANWTSLFADMTAIGLTWLRFQLSWENVELTQGVYTWTVLDDAVSQCNAAHVKIMLTIRGAPTWALVNAAQNATSEPFYIMDPTLTAGFATQLVTRYDGTHGHGHIDGVGWNEDFNIHNTPNSDVLTLNQTLNAGTPYTSFSVNAAAQTSLIGTKLYFGSYGSADVATVATSNIAVSDTTIHVSSFTPASTYTAGTSIKIAYVATNSSVYNLYDPGSGGKTTSNPKSQPARNPIYAAAVFNAVAPAIRAVQPTLPMGMPCTWWTQPINASTYPGSPSNMTAFYQTLFTLCAAHIDANTFMDGHYYSNNVDPGGATIGSGGGSGQVSTIAQWVADFRGAATIAGYPNMALCVSEFGWQANTVTTSSTAVSSAGSHTITCGDTTGAGNGIQAIIDTGLQQETVTITAKTNTTITAPFAKTHSGTYPVTILLDCDAATQATRYTNVLTAINPGQYNNQAFLFTLFYGAGGTGSSLVKADGSHQPAYGAVQAYIAAHSGSSSPGITTYGKDSFIGRTVSNGWGLASDGINYWSQPDGAATPSVSGGEGQLTGKVDTNEMICGSTTVKNLELLVRLSGDTTNFRAGLIARYTNLNNYYFARVNDQNSTLQICKYVSGMLSVVASTTFNPLLSTFYWLRFRINGTSFKAKAWKDGTTEPDWMLSTTDTSLAGSGKFGCYSIANTNGTVISFDTFSAVSTS